jgi:hypothetical protein
MCLDRNLSLDVTAWSPHLHVLDGPPYMPIEMELRLRNVLGSMHVLKVRAVDTVLAHLLWMTANRPAAPLETRPAIVGKLGNFGDLPGGRLARTVMPSPDHLIALDAVPGANLSFGGNTLGIGDISTHACPIELPCVKRAAEVIVFDDATVTEVCAEVWTERIEERNIAPSGSKKDQILTEVPQRKHSFGIELIAIRDLKPAVRNRKRQSFAHWEV